MKLFTCLILVVAGAALLLHAESERPRAREFGLRLGVLAPGSRNAITDVAGVSVGHVTVIKR